MYTKCRNWIFKKKFYAVSLQRIYKQQKSIMKKVFLAIGFALLSLGASAQNILPRHCITILGSVNLNGGAEGLIETEYFYRRLL